MRAAGSAKTPAKSTNHLFLNPLGASGWRCESILCLSLLNDDELDDLFREASDKVDVPFDSSAYNKLRQKIAEQSMSESPNGFKKRWLFLLAGLFLIVGVGLVYRFGNKKEDLINNNQSEIVGNVDWKNSTARLFCQVEPAPVTVMAAPLETA